MLSTNAGVPQTPNVTVRLFSPTDHLPPSLSRMDIDSLQAHIQKANNVIEHHHGVSRNGNPGAEHYYFGIVEVARDMGNARYTLAICFAEIEKRKRQEQRDRAAMLSDEICQDDHEWASLSGPYATPAHNLEASHA